jgi:glutamyl-tRNA synthetase
LLERPTTFDEQTVSKKWKEETTQLMKDWLSVLSNLSSFDHDSIENAFKSFLEDKSVGIGAILPNFRVLLTGTGMGPSMFEIAAFFGKEECLERMNQGLNAIEKIKAYVVDVNNYYNG